MESSAFFCATTKKVKDHTLDNLSTCHTAPPRHLEDLLNTKPPQTSSEDAEATLEADSNWEALFPHTWATDLSHVKVYLNDFIGIVQGGPIERRHMARHFFRAIDDLFQPNDKDETSQEEPISLKKL